VRQKRDEKDRLKLKPNLLESKTIRDNKPKDFGSSTGLPKSKQLNNMVLGVGMEQRLNGPKISTVKR